MQFSYADRDSKEQQVQDPSLSKYLGPPNANFVLFTWISHEAVKVDIQAFYAQYLNP